MSATEQRRLTVAICTSDRPALLRRCLASVATMGSEIWETIVSDDGTDPCTDRIVAEFEGSISRLNLIRGPRLGLAANRNSCIDAAAGDYLLFLDDNAELNRDFISCAMRYSREDTLVTGLDCQGSSAMQPGDVGFIAFRKRPSGSHPRSICMNTTIFPKSFLRGTGFDEFFRYGHEEAEIVLAAAYAGKAIRQVEATNCRNHSSERKDDNQRNVMRSYGYLGVRRYRDYEPHAPRLASFAAFGLLRAAGSGFQNAGVRGGIEAGLSFTEGLSIAVLRRGRRRQPRYWTYTPALTVSVVIPTWRRPAELRACLEGTLRLDPAPDQVVVVRRSEDQAAAQVLSSLGGAAEECIVEESGQVAALQAGARHASGEVVAFTDDDAIPRFDWLRYLVSPYVDPKVAAVGGRDIVHNVDGIEQGATQLVGTVSLFGRTAGGHHIGAGVARAVDHLKGANMSFRRSLLRFPVGLRGEGAQMSNDLATCIALREQGYKVVYDPRALVDHYPGERFDEDRRSDPTLRAFGNAAFNQSFVLFSLRPRRRLVRFAYMLLVGDRASPGLIRVVVATLRRETDVGVFLRTSLQAQWDAWHATRRAPLQMRSVADSHTHSVTRDELVADGSASGAF